MENIKTLLNILLENNEADQNILLDGITKLNEPQRNFIEKKSIEIIEIDNQIINNSNLQSIRPNLLKLQKNILFLYIKKTIPDCSEIINKILTISNKKLDLVNEIIENNLENVTTQQPSTPKPAQPSSPKPPQPSSPKPSSQQPQPPVQPSSPKPAQPPAQAPAQKPAQPPAQKPAQPPTTPQIIAKKPSSESKPKFAANVNENANLVTDELKKGKVDVIVDSYLDQRGGNKDDIIKYIQNLNKIYDIFNSEIILELFGLLSDKELFEKFYSTVFLNNGKIDSSLLIFIDLFFIDCKDYKEIIKLFDSYKIQDKIKRDTFIYKIYNPTFSETKIFAYTLLHLIKLEYNKTNTIDMLITNAEISSEITNLLILLATKIKIINERYKSLASQRTEIKKLYNQLVNKKRRVFTFIKERNDVFTPNPRYKINVKDNRETFPGITDQYLYMRYYNIEGTFGYKDDKYNENQAKLEIKTAVEKFSSSPDEAIILKEGSKLKRDEYYYFGPFDGVYLRDKQNVDVAKSSGKLILDKLTKQDEDICVIGYGQSGSGKTSTLIYFNKEKKDGILIEICKMPSFYNNFNKIELKMVNVYVWHGSEGVSKNSMNFITENDYKYYLMEIEGDKNPTFKFSGNSWIYEKDINDPNIPDSEKKGIGLFIDKAFAQREVEPTPNNPNSSRSHVIVCLTLTKTNGKGQRKFVVCDLAGVENVFNCENINEIYKFDDRYGLSDEYNKEGKTKEILYDRNYCDQNDNNAIFKGTIKNTDLIKNYNDKTAETNKIVLDLENAYKTIEPPQKGKKSSNASSETKSVSSVSKPSTSKQSVTKPSAPVSKISPTKRGGALETCSTKDTINNLVNCPKELLFVKEFNNPTKFEDYGKKIDTKKEAMYQKFLIADNNYKIYLELNKSKNFAETQYKVKDVRDEKQKNKFKEFTGSLNSMGIATKSPVTQFDPDPAFETLKKQIVEKKDELEKAFKEAYTNYKNCDCEKIRLNKLQFNCKLRRNEGYMINASLGGMRNDIQGLIKNSLKLDPSKNDFLPLYYEKEIEPYCRNINLEDEYFDNFYETTKNTKLGGILLKIMSNTPTIETEQMDNNGKKVKTIINQAGFGLDMSKLNFVIFTVINTTNTGKVNNPPNPPYININNLIYYSQIKQDNKKLIAHLKAIFIETKKYTFYQNNTVWLTIATKEASAIAPESIIQLTNEVIDFIKSNNPSTLIGSLESTDILQHLVYNKLVCSYNPGLDNMLTKIKGFDLKSSSIENKNITDINKILDDPTKAL